MSLSCEFVSDWTAPYPFRVLRLQSERDTELGQWEVEFAILGLSISLTWVYDEDTETRRLLRERLDDVSWLEKSRVCMPYADYEELKADADKWRESQGTGREKGA